MEMLSLFSAQMEGSGVKTSFIPCHEEGIQTSLLPLRAHAQHSLQAGGSRTSTQTCTWEKGGGSSKQDCTGSARQSGEFPMQHVVASVDATLRGSALPSLYMKNPGTHQSWRNLTAQG